jgi:hypothetical protein
MSFEKRVLAVAEESGIKGAYFAYGSMFFSPDDCRPSTPDAVEAFAKAYCDGFNGEPRFSDVGAEISVDFVLTWA